MTIKTCEGRWCFDNGKIYDRVSKVEVPYFFEPDFLESWVYAKFLRQDILALGFVTGQPFSEFGSYGDRLKGTIVLKNTDQYKWTCLSFECEKRDPGDDFDLIDVAWHESVLAILTEGELELIFSDKPRGAIDEWIPQNDSHYSSFTTCFKGNYSRLKISDDGNHLYAYTDSVIEKFDLWYIESLREEISMDYARDIIYYDK